MTPLPKRVRIELDRPVRDSKVFIDDVDVSHLCRGVDIHAEIGEVAQVTLHMIPRHVEITAFGDVHRHYGEVKP
jgi:hypothetical protein